MKGKIRIFEGFAGYGGASFATKRMNKMCGKKVFYTIGFSEIEPSAIDLYNANHKDEKGNPLKNWGDIKDINPLELPEFDMFSGGFPCQPFSSAGSLLGELDERGSLFAEIIKICQVKKPKYIFLENVPNLCRGKCKPTFDAILDLLKAIGYDVRTVILNSKDYGVPQSRSRLWFFGVRFDQGGLPDDFDITPPVVDYPERIEQFLDANPSEDLYRTQKQIKHIIDIHEKDDNYFRVKERLCYDYYNKKIREDKFCMTVTPPNHNVVRIVEPPIDGQIRFRKLSVDEHFRLMGFKINDEEREIVYPDNLTYTQLGARAGNGWEVNVVTVLLNHIFNQL